MKAVAVLGTGSNSGKSWLATALCVWLRRQGVRVAPFKAQNMSNNSYVTEEGGEIGRAQAVQAEACGLKPRREMNPILLKPSGGGGSQLILLGRAREHLPASEYYKRVPALWETVQEALAYWSDHCDVLVLEGAGSPVELNLLERDIVNLKPLRHLDGRWLLVGDVERGGVFAQLVGTWNLLSPEDRSRGLGAIVNKFRGDLELFADAPACLAKHVPLPLLGTLPCENELQPESEDSLCQPYQSNGDREDTIAWVRLPHLSNSQDAHPWLNDQGVHVQWTTSAADLRAAKAIVLPGTKNSIADLQWLHDSHLSDAIRQAADRGIPIVGLCGGYQMLGSILKDPSGWAGDPGEIHGLNLLPIETLFYPSKTVRQVTASWHDAQWTAYEIHMGETERTARCPSWLKVQVEDDWYGEGCRLGNIRGTYLHGVFEAPEVRMDLASEAKLANYRSAHGSWEGWKESKRALYERMALTFERYVDTRPLWNYVAN